MADIAVTNLVKTYTYHHKEAGLRGSLTNLVRRRTMEKRAVDGVSFQIEPGEVVGFLGPNGAGKTTTLKVLCGLLYPTGGEVSVLGHVPARREPAFLRRIALVMGQKNMLWWDVSAMETFLLHKEMYGLRGPEFRAAVDELAAMLDVERLLGVQVRKLSLGERMKLELMAALIHRPAVLFLDEPTIGLDVVSQQRVREFLRALNAQHGTTILLTSHYMDDIEALCPRVLVVDHGRIGYDGALAALVESTDPRKIVRAVFAAPVTPDALAAVTGNATLLSHNDPLKVELSVAREDVAEIAGRFLQMGRVADLEIEEPPIEDVIRQVFGGSNGKAGL
ncbi:MAG: ATP-binding cassette domain-containing protein [Chloroflexota bacterium]|nr:ATP-binding cassette domain-containing protein [Chloroflexota bacterium]